MDDLRISYCQSELAWHDWSANRDSFNSLLTSIGSNADIILLPETFASAYTMDPASVAQAMDGPAVEWMCDRAAESDAVVAGSLVISEDGKYYNRMVCAWPDRSISFYDKRHLFTYAGEHAQYTPGNHRLIIEVKGWRICLMICYDLRFPVWSRYKGDYDVLVYVANWPAPRVNAWDALLCARAIENQSYVVGVNRIGSDENGHNYLGHSRVVDYAGHLLLDSEERFEVGAATLNYQKLEDFRQRYNFLADRDAFILK